MDDERLMRAKAIMDANPQLRVPPHLAKARETAMNPQEA